MRKTVLFGVGTAVAIALVGFAMPAMATDGTTGPGTPPTGASSPTSPMPTSPTPTSPTPTSPSPSSSSSQQKYDVEVEFEPSTVVRGGTVQIILSPACSGTISSDAFDAEASTVVAPKHDAPFPAKIRSDAALGVHVAVMTCADGNTGHGTFTVVGQTVSKPAGGVETGGGAAASPIGTVTP